MKGAGEFGLREDPNMLQAADGRARRSVIGHDDAMASGRKAQGLLVVWLSRVCWVWGFKSLYRG